MPPSLISREDIDYFFLVFFLYECPFSVCLATCSNTRTRVWTLQTRFFCFPSCLGCLNENRFCSPNLRLPEATIWSFHGAFESILVCNRYISLLFSFITLLNNRNMKGEGHQEINPETNNEQQRQQARWFLVFVAPNNHHRNSLHFIGIRAKQRWFGKKPPTEVLWRNQ